MRLQHYCWVWHLDWHFFFPHFPQRRLSHLAAFIDLFWNNFSKLLYVSLYRLWTNKVLGHLIWSTCWYRESVQHCMCSRSCPVHLRMCVGDLWPFPFLMTPLLTLCLAITFSSSFPNNFSFWLRASFVTPSAKTFKLVRGLSAQIEEGRVTVLTNTY